MTLQATSWASTTSAAPALPQHGGARAYCGPAHGLSWGIAGDGPPPAVVELDTGARLVRYRLVRQPRNRQPARDHLGNYLYVPVQHDLDLEL